MVQGKKLNLIYIVVALALLATPSVSLAASSTTPKVRAAAATLATKKVRSKYQAGADGPTKFDCSGLVTFAYASSGARLDARSSYEMWEIGTHVKRSKLKRGDLVWTWDQSRGHVGIFLGAGKYVHAPGKGRRVEIAPLPSGENFVGAVRP